MKAFLMIESDKWDPDTFYNVICNLDFVPRVGDTFYCSPNYLVYNEHVDDYLSPIAFKKKNEPDYSLDEILTIVGKIISVQLEYNATGYLEQVVLQINASQFETKPIEWEGN